MEKRDNRLKYIAAGQLIAVLTVSPLAGRIDNVCEGKADGSKVCSDECYSGPPGYANLDAYICQDEIPSEAGESPFSRQYTGGSSGFDEACGILEDQCWDWSQN